MVIIGLILIIGTFFVTITTLAKTSRNLAIPEAITSTHEKSLLNGLVPLPKENDYLVEPIPLHKGDSPNPTLLFNKI